MQTLNKSHPYGSKSTQYPEHQVARELDAIDAALHGIDGMLSAILTEAKFQCRISNAHITNLPFVVALQVHRGIDLSAHNELLPKRCVKCGEMKSQ